MAKKVIGYVEMKKRVGKVLFVVNEEKTDFAVGYTGEKIFLYDDISNKITPECIGKSIEISYGRGYNGNAFVSDLHIK